jgi:hypothetical protein
MKGTDVVFGVASVIYSIVSLTLALISLAMVAYALWEVWTAIATNTAIIQKILDAIGLIVVAVAVFDVAKYLMEEEVLRDRELRSAREARRTLTKFLVIITIAVNLEALVFIFGAGSTDISTLLYPTALLAAGTLMVIGLGIFQRLSVSAEEKTEPSKPKKSH